MRKYKLFGKIPIFDFVIIVILLIAAFIGFKLLTTSKSGVSFTTAEEKEIVYTVKFFDISEQINTMPKVGEKVIESTTNYSLGTVESVKKEPCTVYDYNTITGDLVTTTHKDRYNFVIEIRSTAISSDIETVVGGTRIGLGKGLACSMPSLYASGVVISMKEVNK